MDSEKAENSVRVEPEKTWTDAILAMARPSDHGVTDEEMFELLNPVGNGEPLAQLLAARDISVPMYCVWKAKYRQLSLDQLRRARSRERWRARGALAGLVVAAMVGASGIALGLALAMPAKLTVREGAVGARYDAGSTTSSAPASNRPADPAGRAGVPNLDSAPSPSNQRAIMASDAAAAAVVPNTTSSDRQPSADAPPVTTEPGYKIQVAAANTEPEGRAIIERLAATGYRSYLLRATVNDAEVFRVRVGPFDTLESAQEAAARLRQDGYSGAWIAQ